MMNILLVCVCVFSLSRSPSHLLKSVCFLFFFFKLSLLFLPWHSSALCINEMRDCSWFMRFHCWSFDIMTTALKHMHPQNDCIWASINIHEHYFDPFKEKVEKMNASSKTNNANIKQEQQIFSRKHKSQSIGILINSFRNTKAKMQSSAFRKKIEITGMRWMNASERLQVTAITDFQHFNNNFAVEHFLTIIWNNWRERIWRVNSLYCYRSSKECLSCEQWIYDNFHELRFKVPPIDRNTLIPHFSLSLSAIYISQSIFHPQPFHFVLDAKYLC